MRIFRDGPLPPPPGQLKRQTTSLFPFDRAPRLSHRQPSFEKGRRPSQRPLLDRAPVAIEPEEINVVEIEEED